MELLINNELEQGWEWSSTNPAEIAFLILFIYGTSFTEEESINMKGTAIQCIINETRYPEALTLLNTVCSILSKTRTVTHTLLLEDPEEEDGGTAARYHTVKISEQFN